MNRDSDDIDNEYFEISSEFRADPTIENYLSIRKSRPADAFDVHLTTGPDWLLQNLCKLEALGIDPRDFAGAMKGGSQQISRISLRLLELIAARRALESSGETHIVSRGAGISDALVNFFIASFLDRMSSSGNMALPTDLLVLMRHQLVGDGSAYDDDQRKNGHRQAAVQISLALRKRGDSGSIRQVAKMMKRSPSTVARWFDEQDFEEAVEALRRAFDQLNAMPGPDTSHVPRWPNGYEP